MKFSEDPSQCQKSAASEIPNPSGRFLIVFDSCRTASSRPSALNSKPRNLNDRQYEESQSLDLQLVIARSEIFKPQDSQDIQTLCELQIA